MRADESIQARAEGKRRLLDFLEFHKEGAEIPIDSWYKMMRGMGLEHSHRQRLSELRKDGYEINFNRAKKVYVWGGRPGPGQLELEVNG